MSKNNPIRFPRGQMLTTPGVLATFDFGFCARCIARHLLNDWGDVDAEDKKTNDWAVKNEARILSAYIHPQTKEKLWIITEADRSATTLLLPDEY